MSTLRGHLQHPSCTGIRDALDIRVPLLAPALSIVSQKEPGPFFSQPHNGSAADLPIPAEGGARFQRATQAFLLCPRTPLVGPLHIITSGLVRRATAGPLPSAQGALPAPCLRTRSICLPPQQVCVAPTAVSGRWDHWLPFDYSPPASFPTVYPGLQQNVILAPSGCFGAPRVPLAVPRISLPAPPSRGAESSRSLSGFGSRRGGGPRDAT